MGYGLADTRDGWIRYCVAKVVADRAMVFAFEMGEDPQAEENAGMAMACIAHVAEPLLKEMGEKFEILDENEWLELGISLWDGRVEEYAVSLMTTTH